jgi:hypothetical protein
MIFVGSVNTKNTLSSFSDTAGTGNLVSTNNVQTSYSSRWIMAGGENIIAPLLHLVQMGIHSGLVLVWQPH